MDDFDQKTPWQRWRGRLIALVVVVLVALAVWQFAGHQVGVRRSAPRIATITPLPPPPPPPKEKPPEPKKVEETKQGNPKADGAGQTGRSAQAGARFAQADHHRWPGAGWQRLVQ